MRTQAEYIALGPHHKNVLLPLVSEWAEVFSAWTLDKDKAPASHSFPIPNDRNHPNTSGYPCTIGPYMMAEYADGTQTINGYTSTKYRHGSAVYVRLIDDVARQVFESTIGISDQMHFKMIEWNDREAVIICEHGQIIGSRWVAVIDPSTIPAEVRES
jgi:hypothetical protein